MRKRERGGGREGMDESERKNKKEGKIIFIKKKV